MIAALALATLAAEPPSFRASDGGSLVLEHTSVRAEVQAGLAVVTVRQSFHNPYDAPIDATYLFPLPPDAAVRGMTMTCGDRVVEGELRGREEARDTYEKAAAEGRKAALLEQERPNLFRQSVASLCPGEDVVIELSYADPLVVEDGRRELVFPTTVGPRYRPGDVPEPPFTTLPAHVVDVTVVIDEAMAAESVWSDSHAITIDEDADGRVVVRNTVGDDLPNRDFALAWTFAGGAHRLGAVALPPVGAEAGYVALTIEPAVLEDLAEVRGRELLFVLDQSCSMQGEPYGASVATVEKALADMRPDDTFNLVRFSDDASSLFPEPRPPTPAAIAEARRWLEGFDGGGTAMTTGIVHSLDMPGDPDRLRLVLMLTDGYIGDEAEVLDVVARHLGDARLFSLGVGASVNRFLLDALADVGRGDVAYQLPDTPIEETVGRFYARIARPALTDVTIDWGGLEVTEVYPSRIPDVFAGQPIRVVARYSGSIDDAVITVTGDTGRESVSFSRRVALRSAATHEALPVLWARRKIADLGRTLRRAPERHQAEVTAVALRHHLVSPFTSLVATEKTPSACGPSGVEVAVPSMVPAGVDGGLAGLGSKGSGFGGGGVGYGGGLGSIGVIGGGLPKPQPATEVRFQPPTVLGSLDRDLVQRVMKRHVAQLRYCYERALTKNPSLAGKVVVKLVIGADGTVASAVVDSSTMGAPEVEQCVISRVRRMRFPAPTGGVVTVTYPFVFKEAP